MKKVLAIDDEIDFLTILKLNLEGAGDYKVIISTNAGDIVRLVNDNRPDVILMDILMPGVTGFDALDMLNNDPVGAGTPVIALSALEKQSDKMTAYKKGVVDYLNKPISKEDVIKKIERAISRKSL
ncbi:MAG TPA: response regulator [Candidatus Omnitrophota bacterium]|nr:response regulator [Candidatus Omnitrophota bacterium]